MSREGPAVLEEAHLEQVDHAGAEELVAQVEPLVELVERGEQRVHELHAAEQQLRARVRARRDRRRLHARLRVPARGGGDDRRRRERGAAEAGRDAHAVHNGREPVHAGRLAARTQCLEHLIRPTSRLRPTRRVNMNHMAA